MKVKLLDTETGETIVEEDDSSIWYWLEGNGSCDCNRELAFREAIPTGICLGCKRFLVIDVDGDLDGYSREEFIEEANREYPESLKQQWLHEKFAMNKSKIRFVDGERFVLGAPKIP